MVENKKPLPVYVYPTAERLKQQVNVLVGYNYLVEEPINPTFPLRALCLIDGKAGFAQIIALEEKDTPVPLVK